VNELDQFDYGLLALGLFVVVPLLATRSSVVRRYAGQRLLRLGAWMWDQFVSEPEVDPLAEELYRVRRIEQLRTHIARLQRILATDSAMSATRQLANRMAYDWLVTELERTRNLSRNIFADHVLAGWDPSMVGSAVVAPSITFDPQRGSTVEILDIGWRH